MITNCEATSDTQIMQYCLSLASIALGRTSPNPLVGAVVVREGKIVGEGFHPGAGKPHAEVFALKTAGDLAQGATVYVNLEPCNHYGRTPPCTEALIAAGVVKVVVGMIDPDPRVSGGGIQRLREAGLEVVVGVEEKACGQLNEAFIHRVKYHTPFGILKYAMTLDGKIASNTGHSAWVTGEKAREKVHQLRSTCDAVIVGTNTVKLDNPRLTTHGMASHNPLRVVMSRTLDLPTSAHLWNTKVAYTVVLTQQGVKPEFQQYLRDLGVEVMELQEVTPPEVMKHLCDRGMSTVLWECGGTLSAQAISSGMVQKLITFIAPKLIGGTHAYTPIGDLGLSWMTQAIPLEDIQIDTIDGDIVIQGYLRQQVNPDSESIPLQK